MFKRKVFLYVLFPYFEMFVLGFGAGNIIQRYIMPIYLVTLLLLLVYSCFLLIQSFRCLIQKKNAPLFPRAIILLVAIILVCLEPAFASCLRRLGADVRLKIEGGDMFCEQLLSDASQLIEKMPKDRQVSLSIEQLPPSFRQVGGLSAQIQGGVDALVDIKTFDAHETSGWILVPEPSSASVGSNYPVRVKARIYRY